MAENLQRMLRQLGGQTAIVAGHVVVALVDKAGVDFGDGVVVDTSLLVVAEDVPTVADASAVTIGSTAYKVRQVLPEPPDGALLRLPLVRV